MLPQALKLNPAFFKMIYTDLLNAQEDARRASRRRSTRSTPTSPSARRAVRADLDHLRDAGEARSCSEIEDHFKRHFDIERRDHRVRVPRRSGTDRQGLDAGAAHQEEQHRRAGAGVLLRWRRCRRTATMTRRGHARGEPRHARRSPYRARASTTSRTSRWRSRATASIVVTGLSGSGKSSLAFDTIYAEGQRRYMESLSSYAKRFVAQVTKPDVDFVFGLSPVISIEQKTLTNNPRSTVGTMTDIASYLNLLFRDDRPGALPAHRRADAEPIVEPDPRSRSCRCPKARRSSCARRCSRSTARTSTSSSRRCARRAAAG